MVDHIVTNRAKDGTSDGAHTSCAHDNHASILLLSSPCDHTAWFHSPITTHLDISQLKGHNNYQYKTIKL